VASAADLADRLDFTLPDFTRVSWTSDPARDTWEPRRQRIGGAWAEVEWRSVAARVRRCNLTRFQPDELPDRSAAYGEHGLSVMALGLEGASELSYSSTPKSYEPGKPFVVCAAVGRLEDLVEFSDAWRSSDHDAMGALLGYPACCRDFFRRFWVDDACVDTTWAMARNTVVPANGERSLEVTGPTTANILMRWWGVRAVPHLPCAFDCSATAEFASELLRVGVESGYSDEMDWIEEILSWPVQWSALHGIAEIKTPLLKIVTRTDATASRHIVRRPGAGFPVEGATGLSFPYQVPERSLVSDSAGFHRGLEHPIALTRKPAPPEWHHRDNGFTSRHGMDRAHDPLVSLARRELAGRAGPVLDLGCGNGALLSKIVEGQTGLVPYGVDCAPESIAHARELHPRFEDNFAVGDLFDTATWPAEDNYALALLMVGRLLEVPAPKAGRLLAAIRARCDTVVLYVYPGYSDSPLEDLARRLGLRLDEQKPGTAGLLVSVESARRP
jgi:SAM-dependent methyltransferase